mmetsp:Transcript_4293/g.10670  ORF Transcript_4293/g.10670 Transcript_4293/m.10670 type:complete len:427 (-) Transcript_4293:127-1407(-)
MATGPFELRAMCGEAPARASTETVLIFLSNTEIGATAQLDFAPSFAGRARGSTAHSSPSFVASHTRRVCVASYSMALNSSSSDVAFTRGCHMDAETSSMRAVPSYDEVTRPIELSHDMPEMYCACGLNTSTPSSPNGVAVLADEESADRLLRTSQMATFPLLSPVARNPGKCGGAHAMCAVPFGVTLATSGSRSVTFAPPFIVANADASIALYAAVFPLLEVGFAESAFTSLWLSSVDSAFRASILMGPRATLFLSSRSSASLTASAVAASRAAFAAAMDFSSYPTSGAFSVTRPPLASTSTPAASAGSAGAPRCLSDALRGRISLGFCALFLAARPRLDGVAAFAWEASIAATVLGMLRAASLSAFCRIRSSRSSSYCASPSGFASALCSSELVVVVVVVVAVLCIFSRRSGGVAGSAASLTFSW